MAKKILLIVVSTLAFINLTIYANVIFTKEDSEKRECLSCSLVDEVESRALFAINRFIESTVEDGKYTSSEEALNGAIEMAEKGNNFLGFYAEFSEFKFKEILTDVLLQLKAIKNPQGCREEESVIVDFFEARLIEGEEPTNPNIPYIRRELSILLEKYHIEMVKECIKAIKLTTHSVKNTPEYKQLIRDFLKFAKFTIERVLPETKHNYKIKSIENYYKGAEGILTASAMFSLEDKKLLSTLIKDFFGGGKKLNRRKVEDEDEIADKVWLSLDKYKAFKDNIASNIEALFFLADYNPQRYAPSKIVDSEKENRKIFKVANLIKDLLNTDLEALKLIGSYALLDKTFVHFNKYGITGEMEEEEELSDGLYGDDDESDLVEYEII